MLCALLLQKPSRTSKARDHAQCLHHRLESWRAGDIDNLVREGKAIQCRLPRNTPSISSVEQVSRNLAKLMFEGKVKAAIRLLSTQPISKVLPPNLPLSSGAVSETVLDSLQGKHPAGQAAQPESIVQPSPPIHRTHTLQFSKA